MEQFDNIIEIIKTILQYLQQGRMQCSQIPVDDLMTFVSEEYMMFQLDAGEAIAAFRDLFKQSILQNDVSGVCNLLKLLILENATFKKLHSEIEHRMDLDGDSIPRHIELLYLKNKLRNLERAIEENSHEHHNRFTGRCAVYSAITGGYDSVRDPDYIDPNIDYYLFTDNAAVHSNHWKVIYIENPENLDSIRLARKIKILGCYDYLSSYDYTIWIDGKLQIIGDLTEYIHKYSENAPILCFNHYCNSDIVDEANSCLHLNRDNPQTINAQVKDYLASGYPKKSGMVDSCLLVRDNHDDLLKETMLDWWNEVKNRSFRDQLSFNYVCWKNTLSYDTSPLYSFDNPYVKTYKHGE